MTNAITINKSKRVKINFRNIGLAAALFGVIYTSSGCNEATVLGTDLIPGGDLVNSKDSTISGIITHNILSTDSSVFTGQGNYNKILGAITADPIFGRSAALVYTQMGLPSAGFTFQGAGQTLDSVVLSITYNTYAGDSLGAQTLRVYRMNETNFKIDSNYRYYQALKYNQSEFLGTTTMTPKGLSDSVSVYGKKEAPQLRIRLSDAFGRELMSQKSDGAFKNDSTFRAWLKGFAIVPDTSAGNLKSMLFLNLNSATTKLTVFYKSSTEDSLRSAFQFGSLSSAHANYFVRNYNNSLASRYINTSKPEGDSLLFLQDAPGLYTRLSIPKLEDFPNAVINKAELVITQVITGSNDQNNIFTEPDRLLLSQYTKGDTTKPIIDMGDPQRPNWEYFGGDKKVVTNFGGVKVAQYTFNIGRYLQMLIKKLDTNNGFKLEGYSSRNIDVHRAVAGGGNNAVYNVKLRVIYTKP